jgi:hypothetical protein
MPLHSFLAKLKQSLPSCAFQTQVFQHKHEIERQVRVVCIHLVNAVLYMLKLAHLLCKNCATRSVCLPNVCMCACVCVCVCVCVSKYVGVCMHVHVLPTALCAYQAFSLTCKNTNIHSGRTSSLSQRLLGYDHEGRVLNYAGQEGAHAEGTPLLAVRAVCVCVRMFGGLQ